MKIFPHIVIFVSAAAMAWTGCNSPKHLSSKPNREIKTTARLELEIRPAAALAAGHSSFDTNIFLLPQPLPVRRIEPALRIFPESGIYKTAPYSMIVIVPKPCDERFVINAVDSSSRMPVIKPELEFIPRELATR